MKEYGHYQLRTIAFAGRWKGATRQEPWKNIPRMNTPSVSQGAPGRLTAYESAALLADGNRLLWIGMRNVSVQTFHSVPVDISVVLPPDAAPQC